MNPMRRPGKDEFFEYYQNYIDKVEGKDFLTVLENAKESTLSLLHNLEDLQWSYRYEAGKWTTKEVLIHLIDTERIFSYRALRIARNDMTALAGFDQDMYVPNANAYSRSKTSIIEEYEAVRASTLQLYKGMDPTAYSNIGKASNYPVSPLALGFITAGHEIHHIEYWLFLAKTQKFRLLNAPTPNTLQRSLIFLSLLFFSPSFPFLIIIFYDHFTLHHYCFANANIEGNGRFGNGFIADFKG